MTAIAGWLRERVPAGECSYSSSSFTAEYPEAAPYREIASGLLATFVDESRENLLLWFRPEVPSTVTWGGDPRKPVLAGSGPVAVLPRRSFERWVEERTGFAGPWAEWQVQLAGSLAEAVEGVVLRQRRKIDELTSLLAEKERLLEQKDLLTREIDHRVKNSLQIVSAFLQMQRRQIADGAARQAFADTSARVMSVARVHDSLYQAERFDEVDLGQTLESLCNDLAGLAGEGHAVDLSAEPGLMVPYRKAVALSLIATELVTNAFKYAANPAGGGRVEVSVSAAGPGEVQLRVCDDGAGLPDDWADAKAPRQGLGPGDEADPGDARPDQRPARRRQQSRRLLHDHRVSPDDPIPRDGVHARLRAATGPAHRALEDTLDWRARVATLPGYRDLLARLHGFHAVWESAIGAGLADEPFLAPRRRLARLAADLGHLGLAPEAITALPATGRSGPRRSRRRDGGALRAGGLHAGRPGDRPAYRGPARVLGRRARLLSGPRRGGGADVGDPPGPARNLRGRSVRGGGPDGGGGDDLRGDAHVALRRAGRGLTRARHPARPAPQGDGQSARRPTRRAQQGGVDRDFGAEAPQDDRQPAQVPGRDGIDDGDAEAFFSTVCAGSRVAVRWRSLRPGKGRVDETARAPYGVSASSLSTKAARPVRRARFSRSAARIP